MLDLQSNAFELFNYKFQMKSLFDYDKRERIVTI